MREPHTRVVEFVEALGEAEPVGQHDDDLDGCGQPETVALRVVEEMTVKEEANRCANVGDGNRDAGQNVSHEEVPELHLSERRNEDVPECLE